MRSGEKSPGFTAGDRPLPRHTITADRHAHTQNRREEAPVLPPSVNQASRDYLDRIPIDYRARSHFFAGFCFSRGVLSSASFSSATALPFFRLAIPLLTLDARRLSESIASSYCSTTPS